jgi:hypothetical protein
MGRSSSQGSSSNNTATGRSNDAYGDPLFYFYGTAAANNKTLRKELVSFRNKRDKFLARRMQLLLPFLPEKVIYF